MVDRIAVVEDEPDVRATAIAILADAGFEAVGYPTGEHALAGILASPPDLVLLDVRMPGIDGLELCRRLRHTPHTSLLPIVMLTGLAGEEDVVLGLDVSADDYLTKPLRARTLVAHVRAVLRRAHPRHSGPSIQHGPLTLVPALHQATLHGKPLSLTPSEFQIVHLLASSPDRIVSRDEIIERLGVVVGPSGRKVDLHVAAIRGKLVPHTESSGTGGMAENRSRGCDHSIEEPRARSA